MRHPKASEENRQTRLTWMLKEGSDGRVAWRIDQAIFDPNLKPDDPQQTWELLRQIRCPTLILRGGESDVLSVDTCQKMLSCLPDGQWVEIPGAGHMVLEDNPEACNTALFDFLKR